MKARRLTVAQVGDAWRIMTGAEKAKSRVTLAGAWLRAAGFAPGDRCRIESGRGLLLVIRENPNDSTTR
jgi:hypothetical protein